jgi:hypothetical protein
VVTADTAQWVTLAGVIVGILAGFYRDARNRRWAKEDADELATKLDTHRAHLAEKVATAADTATGRMIAESEKLGSAIQTNTDISTKAFHEANSVNLKIEKLGIDHNALQRAKQKTQVRKRK